MRPACVGIQRMILKFWRGLREWSGDRAYERYLQARATRRAECAPLSRERFYVEQLNRRYSQPNRCC
jgi:uncharacterized short protein YbdD (DUF466 family)